MKKLFFSLLSALAFSQVMSQEFIHQDINKNITPFHDAQDAMDGKSNAHLLQQAAWKTFTQNHPGWGASFNRYTQLPHRAFGTPIVFAPGGNNAEAKAKLFIQSELAGFNIPVNELVLTRNYNDGKYIHVDFKQVHNGMDVLWSRVGVRFTQDLRIVLVGMDAYKNIPNLTTTITAASAEQYASQAITNNVESIQTNPDLKIFPVPVDGANEYHLVYETTVNTMDQDRVPGKYLCYVDATNGKIIYRQNQVKHFNAKVKGDVRPVNQYTPAENRPMKNLKVVVGGTTYYTDNDGVAVVPGTTNVNTTLSLEGKWVKVLNSAASATASANYAQTFANSDDSTNFNVTTVTNSSDRGVNVYYHVNEVHDFMKAKFPTFTVMDNALPANVDVAGTCNAFYNGTSINFYAAGGGCNAFSLIGDVMSHEYGHGISDKFYTWQGASFDNGAMGEGYSDTWASGILKTGIIGLGVNSATSSIRDYTGAPKVYPVDIVGEVHADGEIIAGAWWDVSINFGTTMINPIDSMSDLFASTYFGLATGPDGTEGQVFHDILIDALTYDDNNANLNDGTPHFMDIVQAFAKHGIFLLSNAELNHANPISVSAGVPLVIQADAIVDYPAFLGDVKMFYRLKGTTPQDSILMTKVGTTFTTTFPSSTSGEVYEYYFNIYDNANAFAASSPINSKFNLALNQRNLPYYLLIGYSSYYLENFDNITSTTPNWIVGTSTNDNATAGKWIVAVPISSATNGDTVQTGHDHTTGSGKCAVTGNATSATAQAGSADVDNGRTSLVTDEFDISNFNMPVFSYWRWFSNRQSSNNPGKDTWKAYGSYNNGTTWFQLEKTYAADVSWRRNLFIPNKSVGTKVRFMFVATDSVSTGVTGTWVEAAIDDIEILDLSAPASTSSVQTLNASIFPNPAKDILYIMPSELGMVHYSILNMVGETLVSANENCTASNQQIAIPTNTLSNGIYFIKLELGSKQSVMKFTIAK